MFCHVRCVSVAIALILALVLIAGACHHRAPVNIEEDGGVLPDAWSADAAIVPADLGSPQVCRPAGKVAASRYTDPRGHFTLGFGELPLIHTVTMTAASSKTSAAAFNLPGMAAMAATRDALKKDAPAELAQIRLRLSNVVVLSGHKAAKVVLRASGISGKSHDGYPSVKEAIWDVNLINPMDPAKLRDLLVASATELQSTSSLANLPPGNVSSASKQLMVRLSLVQRPGQVALVAAVANRADYDHTSSDLFRHVDDASNGTSLSVAGGKLIFHCDATKVTSAPKADIIWVVDESGSMSDNRNDIVNNASDFFNRALMSGLDFRMGVTNVCSPNSNYKASVGKFCSRVSTNTKDDGGVDRFLLPGEQAIFASCIKNPTGYEGGSEYGIVNAREAVKRHLPRSANDPSKIRPDATLVIIVATDEVPNSLISLVSGAYTTCSLAGPTQTSLNASLASDLALFAGATDPQAKAMFHVIGGVCSNACNAQIAHGYKELAQQLGGQIGDVCQKNLGKTLQVIVDSIVGASSPQKLQHTPISSTLAVTLAGKRLKCSRSAGFRYNVASNTLTFVNVPLSKGEAIEASYHRFQ
jgi:hypothetical protein